MSLTQRIFQRLLRESQEEREERGRRRLAQASGLAVCHETHGTITQAIVYEPARLLEFIDEITDPNDEGNAMNVILDWVIRGVIEIIHPNSPCNGARVVAASAVKRKGDGGLIYGVAFALSPKGILTPDRHSVSEPAQDGWIKQASRGGKPFDDASLPPEQQRTPNDPSDDCRIHKKGDGCRTHLDLDALNRSYEDEGWEKGMFRKMEDTHLKTMQGLTVQQEKQVSQLLFKCFDDFFSEHYEG